MPEEFHPKFDLSIDDSSNGTIMRGRTQLGSIRAFGNQVWPYVLPPGAQRFLQGRSPKRMPMTEAALSLRMASTATRLVAQLSRQPGAECSTRTIEGVDARFDQFYREVSAPFKFIAERTAAFLDWRYAAPRAGNFTIRVAERDGRLLGYAVTKAGGE